MTARKATAAKASVPARVRRPTAAELAAAGGVTPGQEVWVEPPAAELDPDVDFDLAAWRDDLKAQQVEATRGAIRFRLDDRRLDAPAPTYQVEIPLLGRWKGKALRRLEDRTPAAIIDSIGMATGDPELVDVLDELTQDEVGAVLQHLVDASGVTPGESKPSGASSRSTRRR